MKTKIFTLLSLSVLALVMVMSFGSAGVLAEWTFDSEDLIADIGTATLTINEDATASYVAGNPSTGEALSTANWDAGEYYEIIIDLTGYQDIILSLDEEISPTGPAQFKIQYSSDGTTFTDLTGSVTLTVLDFTPTPMHTYDFSSIIVLNNNADVKFRITIPNDAGGNFHLDNLLIEGTEYTAEPEDPEFCNWEDGWNLGGVSDNPGELEIKDIEVTNNGVSSTKFGDDESWFLFEEIEVEIEVENKGDYDIDDISIEWGLYNEETEQWTIEVDEAEELNLRDGDEETISITFKIDDDMDEDLDELVDGTYRLYVRATGIVDNVGDDETCTSDYNEISMIIEKDFVILNDIKYLETASCNTVVELTADVWNIGSDDQEDVFVRVYNEELGINEQIDIGDIDAFEDEEISFLLSIPEDAEEKEYVLSLGVYDEYEDMFENDFDEDRAKFTQTIVIEGNCINEPKVTISADLESEAKAGKELIIKTTIVNTGTETSTFEISPSDYILWATFGSISSESITLDAGESAEVMITLNVNSDVSGNQNFEIVVTEGTKVLAQPVSVMIEEQGGFAGITGGLISEGNWPIWTIGAINVVLVFVIILVALKVAKKQ